MANLTVMHPSTRSSETERRVLTHEQHASRLALLYDLGRTLIASGNLSDMLARLLERTIAAVGATRGSIMVLERDPSAAGYAILAGAGVQSASEDIYRVLREGVASHVIASRQAIRIDDVRNDARWVRSAIDDAPIAPRSALVVPLVHDTAVIGVLTLWHTQPGYFDADAVELMNAVAAQAAMAIERATAYEQAQRRAAELATLYSERDALYAQERQRRTELATLYAAALDIATGTHLEEVLARTCERAIRLVHAASACVYLMDEARQALHPVTLHNVEPFLPENQCAYSDDLAQRAATTRRIELFASHPDAASTSVAPTRYTLAAVPLICGERVVGVLNVMHQAGNRSFSSQDAQLLQMLSAQAAVAVENSRLLTATRRQIARMRSLARESAPLNALLDPQAALQAVLHLGMVELGADRGMIILLEPAGIGCPLAVGVSVETVAAIRQLGRQVILPTTNAEVLSCPDIAAAPYLAPLHAVLHAEGICGFLSLPLIHDGTPYGTVALLYNQPRPFDPDELEIGRIFANQATVTLTNARLYADLQRSNAELAVASHLKSEFLAMVSHELRTPMNAIIGYSDMIHEGFFGPLPHDLEDPIERVQRNAQHLLKLINDVLDLSMLEAGHLQLAAAPYDLTSLVQTICGDVAVEARERGLAFYAYIEPNLPKLLGDARRVRQIMHHLVANALKFTEQGHIRVQVRTVDPTAAAPFPAVQIEISDTGIGIPAEFRQSIFEAFRQVDGSATRRHGGTGMGLAIVQRLVALMGGRIELESQVGVGSVFRVLLPLT